MELGLGLGRSFMLADRSKATPVVLFGGKGGAEVVAEYFASANDGPEVIGLLNDCVAPGEIIGSCPVLGSFDDWRTLPEDVVFNAPLHKAKDILRRSRRIRNLDIPESRWCTVIHPKASIAMSASLGAGSSVGGVCDLQPGVSLGRHVAVRGGAYLGHDCKMEDFVFVGPNAVVAGYGNLGEGAHIGPGAAVIERCRVGRFSVVGIGAVVVRDVADFEIVAGNPARRIGWVDAEGIY